MFEMETRSRSCKRKRKLNEADAETGTEIKCAHQESPKRIKQIPRFTRESLVLGRHIVLSSGVRSPHNWSFRFVKRPEKMTCHAGQRVRGFVQDLCSRDPMATFARMCLVPEYKRPLVPTPEDKQTLGKLTKRHFGELWKQINNLFHGYSDSDARFSLESMFIRGALTVQDLVPFGWDEGVTVLDLNYNRLLSCDEIVSYVESDKTHNKPSVSTAIKAAHGSYTWRNPLNLNASQRLCKIIESDLFKWVESMPGLPTPDSVVSLVSSNTDLFVSLIPTTPMFADAVCSFVPLESFRRAFQQVYANDHRVYLLCGAIEKAANSRRNNYFKSLCEHGILSPLANIVSHYYI